MARHWDNVVARYLQCRAMYKAEEPKYCIRTPNSITRIFHEETPVEREFESATRAVCATQAPNLKAAIWKLEMSYPLYDDILLVSALADLRRLMDC